MRQATGATLILLNQDTEVRPGWLSALLAPFVDAAVGIAGSKALYPDGTIQHAGGRIDAQGITHHIGRGESDRASQQTLADVDYVSGASLAISRRAHTAIGALDEGFSPAYYEDVDWCVRARIAGFDRSQEEAAKDLGASEWQTYRDVVIPFLKPGIVAGAHARPATPHSTGDGVALATAHPVSKTGFADVTLRLACRPLPRHAVPPGVSTLAALPSHDPSE